MDDQSKLITNFTTDPWKNTVLVTPQHAVCEWWNTEAICKHCAATGEHMYICSAKDTDRMNDKELPPEVRYEIAQSTEKQTGDL